MSVRRSNAYSMGKQTRLADFVNDKRLSHVPGPNHYATPIKDKTQAPTWSVGGDERFRGKTVKHPGPGEYAYAKFTDAGPKFTTRCKPFIDPFKMKTKPGPGLYDPERPKTSIYYSMRQRTNVSCGKLNAVGPGSYKDDRELHYRSIPGSKMGKDNRISNHFLHTASYKKQEPGKYNLHDFAGNELMGVPKYSFARDSRDKEWKAKHPGPGNYDIPTKMADGVPQYSMPGRRKDLRPKVGVGVPGSGTYEPSHSYTKKNGPQFSVGKKNRDGELKIYQNTPGAGTYHDISTNIVRAKSASWRIGSEKRPEKQHYVPPTPGPGTYTDKQKDMGTYGPKFSVMTRPADFRKKAPGPGEYNPDSAKVQNKAARYSLGHQKRTMLKELNSNPGPGAHDSRSQLAGSQYGFGTSTRPQLKPDKTPGPGTYEYQKVVGNSNSAS